MSEQRDIWTAPDAAHILYADLEEQKRDVDREASDTTRAKTRETSAAALQVLDKPG